ncbi:type VI secretion system baseplate subunit TssF [Pseudomonas sp. HR96]|uniref:type VI secretion system baseplate subunit TssF n=1 Tax=Pseudomonas sp. HR96 TaxID=1027966 RepID=UPI002A7578CB|nr:type VI secretion system baseplate subunit TssF [Pseudomonas sp. HR96]WPO98786.1 type VI secretion system baseplate subunit TssF [Pseudomonas sp. HR96]
MPLKRRFREELSYLRESGREFAADHPQLARFLGEQSGDPDVERLLEGFAFLTAKLRLKLDDDLPELTHGLLQMLWPNYLRPLPSATIVRFEPLKQAISRRQVMPKGTRLFSVPVDGVSCEFRTCTEVALYPLEIRQVRDTHSRDESVVQVDLTPFGEQPLNAMGCDQLDLHLSGDESTALTLYLWLARYLHQVRIHCDDQIRSLPANALRFPGFDPEQALLPYPRNVFDGYRILQEYFVFPQRFHFVTLTGLADLWPSSHVSRVRLEFQFKRPMPAGIRIGDDDICLYCAPAVNLFDHSAEPIDIDGRSEHVGLKPSNALPHAYEIFSVDEVVSWRTQSVGKQGGQLRVFTPFESFAHEIETAHGRTALYYRCRIEDALDKRGFQHRIAFVRGDESAYIGERETVSVQLTCTNRDLPLALGVGDISVSNEATPTFATYRNLRRPTRPCRPVLDGSLQWTLISNLSLNYLSLLSAEPLKAVLRAYDFAALHDIQQARTHRKRLDGIIEAHTAPLDWMLKGLPIRGLGTRLQLDQQAFLCEGDLYLFSSVLAQFFALYASINSFHQLDVINTTNNEHYTWPPLTGRQPLI